MSKTFDFKKNGKGNVKTEAIACFDGWSAVIQLLEFTDQEHIADSIQIRFGYFDADGKLIARPLYLTGEQLAKLGKVAANNPEIKKLLEPFVYALK